MEYLTKAQAAGRLRESVPQKFASLIEESDLHAQDFDVHIDLNDECGRFAYLAKVIVEWLAPLPCTLLINDFGIWPSREDRNLLKRLRQSLGDERQLPMAPGHRFHAGEEADAMSHLLLYLLFGYGGVIAADSGKLVHFSHDDWIGLAGEGADRVVSAWEV